VLHGQNCDRLTWGNGRMVSSRGKPIELGHKQVPVLLLPPRDSHKNQPALKPGVPGQGANTKPPELGIFKQNNNSRNDILAVFLLELCNSL
jgi:hypothetical protein